MKTPKAPEAPDPRVTAAAQTGTNVSTAIANANLQNVNQVTPYGNLTYSQSGSYKFTDPTSGASYDVPQFTATQTLSPQQQAIEDQNQGAALNQATLANQQSGYLKDYLGKGVDTSKVPGIQYGTGDTGQVQMTLGSTKGDIQYGFGDAGPITKTYNTDFSADRQRVEDALMTRLNPQLERDRDALQTQLSNQGIKLGSTAYDRGVDEFTRQSNDARLGAILNAGQEQSRLVGLEANRAQFENAAQAQNYDQLLNRASFNNQAQQQDFGQILARGSFANQAQQQAYGQAANNVQMNNAGRSQALNEAYAARNQPINEISALMQGAQVQQPSFVNSNVGAIPTVDYAGLVQQNYQNQMGAYQQQVASRNSMLGGLLGLGGSLATAGILKSDRRLKRDIVRLSTTENGLGIYSFRYANQDELEVGLMAEEVARIAPDAVIVMPDNFHAVDYGKALAA